jgi:hypothetical protein
MAAKWALFSTARKWLKVGLAPVALLGGAGLVLHLVTQGFVADRPVTVEPAPAAGGESAGLAQEQCLKHAFLLYDLHWSVACMVVAEQDDTKHAACVHDPVITNSPELGKDYCDRTFPVRDDSVDCDLPEAQAASLNAWVSDAQQKCQAEANTR